MMVDTRRNVRSRRMGVRVLGEKDNSFRYSAGNIDDTCGTAAPDGEKIRFYQVPVAKGFAGS
jgi:hypothetical protein